MIRIVRRSVYARCTELAGRVPELERQLASVKESLDEANSRSAIWAREADSQKMQLDEQVRAASRALEEVRKVSEERDQLTGRLYTAEETVRRLRAELGEGLAAATASEPALPAVGVSDLSICAVRADPSQFLGAIRDEVAATIPDGLLEVFLYAHGFLDYPAGAIRCETCKRIVRGLSDEVLMAAYKVALFVDNGVGAAVIRDEGSARDADAAGLIGGPYDRLRQRLQAVEADHLAAIEQARTAAP